MKIGKETCLICAGKDAACRFCDGTGVVAVRVTADPQIAKKILAQDGALVNRKTRREAGDGR